MAKSKEKESKEKEPAKVEAKEAKRSSIKVDSGGYVHKTAGRGKKQHCSSDGFMKGK